MSNKRNCLSCRQENNSSRMEMSHSKETSERSQRANLIWCSKVLRRIMLSSWIWWIGSLLVMLGKPRNLQVSSKWWTLGKKRTGSFSSNTAPFQTTTKACRNNSTPLWAPITPYKCNANPLAATAASTRNSTTLQAELHTKIINKCCNKCKFKTCTCKNNLGTIKARWCKTPVAQGKCSRPITTITGSNTFHRALTKVSWLMQIIWLMHWGSNNYNRVIINRALVRYLAIIKEAQVCCTLILGLILVRLGWVELGVFRVITNRWSIISIRITWLCNSQFKTKNCKCKWRNKNWMKQFKIDRSTNNNSKLIFRLNLFKTVQVSKTWPTTISTWSKTRFEMTWRMNSNWINRNWDWPVRPNSSKSEKTFLRVMIFKLRGSNKSIIWIP